MGTAAKRIDSSDVPVDVVEQWERQVCRGCPVTPRDVRLIAVSMLEDSRGLVLAVYEGQAYDVAIAKTQSLSR